MLSVNFSLRQKYWVDDGVTDRVATMPTERIVVWYLQWLQSHLNFIILSKFLAQVSLDPEDDDEDEEEFGEGLHARNVEMPVLYSALTDVPDIDGEYDAPTLDYYDGDDEGGVDAGDWEAAMAMQLTYDMFMNQWEDIDLQQSRTEPVQPQPSKSARRLFQADEDDDLDKLDD